MNGGQAQGFILNEVVEQFEDLIGRFGQHAVAAGDEVYIQPCVYLSLHLASMRAGGWTDVDFDELAAVSGASALFAHQPGEFMPKYANLFIGMDERIANATGYGYEWVRFEGVEGAWNLLKESIESKRPVKGWHWENVLFAGFADDGGPDERKVFALGDGPDTFARWGTWREFSEWVTEWGRGRLGRHTDRVPSEPIEEVGKRVLRDLVEWSTDPPAVVREKYPEAAFGLAGIKAYAENCANTEEYEDWGACHDINGQWTLRNSTAVYLTRLAVAEVYAAEVNEHLLSAAQEYRAAYLDWRELYNQLGHQAPENAGRMRDRRLAGAAAIRMALEHEKRGIEEIRAVLKALERSPGATR